MRRVVHEVMSAILTEGPIESTTSGGVATAVEDTRNAERSSGGDVAEEPFQYVVPSLGLFADGERVRGERCDGLAHGR